MLRLSSCATPGCCMRLRWGFILGVGRSTSCASSGVSVQLFGQRIRRPGRMEADSTHEQGLLCTTPGRHGDCFLNRPRAMCGGGVVPGGSVSLPPQSGSATREPLVLDRPTPGTAPSQSGACMKRVCDRKSEIRTSKSETNPKFEGSNVRNEGSKPGLSSQFSRHFPLSRFGIVSDFGFRYSSFGFAVTEPFRIASVYVTSLFTSTR